MTKKRLYLDRLLSLVTKTTAGGDRVVHLLIQLDADLCCSTERAFLLKGGSIDSGSESGYTGSIFQTSSAHNKDFRRERR